MIQNIQSDGICLLQEKLSSRTPSTSKCQLACSARLARCSGTGGLLTVASLLETTAASRTFCSPMAIGSIQSCLGGLLELALALDLLVRMDTQAAENSFGTVLTSRCCLEMVSPSRPRGPLRHLLPLPRRRQRQWLQPHLQLLLLQPCLLHPLAGL